MAKVRLRLSEKDRPEYERGDEWFVIDAMLSELDELPWDELDAIERQLQLSVTWLVEVERRSLTVRYLRALAWLARRFAGIKEPYAEFKPNVRKLESEPVDDLEPADAGDADPPEDTPPASADSGESVTRSTRSTPRSRGNTSSRRGKSAS